MQFEIPIPFVRDLQINLWMIIHSKHNLLHFLNRIIISTATIHPRRTEKYSMKIKQFQINATCFNLFIIQKMYGGIKQLKYFVYSVGELKN